MFWFKKEEVATDPVCLMKVNVKKAKFSQVYMEKNYYFCSENCREQFSNDPDKYTE